jgi:hypothetical protein
MHPKSKKRRRRVYLDRDLEDPINTEIHYVNFEFDAEYGL